MATPALTAALLQGQQAAYAYAQRAGPQKVLALLADAQRDLERRLASTLAGDESFTVARLRATLAQVRETADRLARTMAGALPAAAAGMGQVAAGNVLQYLAHAERAFGGVGSQPLAIDVAEMVDGARAGASASVLRRLMSDPAHPARGGILARYGAATVDHFEGVLRRSLVSRASVDEVREDLKAKSPFLQGAPRHWAERVARTELMGAYNRTAQASIEKAQGELGDMVKILCATFDDRTGCLLGSTRLTGAVVRAAFRRWYEGPLLRLVTESGRDLSATPNHPVLTRRGWVCADLLRPGDDLVCDDGEERAGSSRNEDEDGRPPTMSEIFDSLQVLSVVERRRGREQDFHGDGRYGDVDVLRPLRELRQGRLPALHEPSAKHVLAPSDSMNFCSECGVLLGPDACEYGGGLGTTAEWFTHLVQASRDAGLRSVQGLADLLERLARSIAGSNLLEGQPLAVSGMQALGLEPLALRMAVLARESSLSEQLGNVAPMVVQRCGHLPDRHAASIKLDRLVLVERTSYRGHVFNLSTADGYFTANGIYTSNSDSFAVHGQIRRPEEPFVSWFGAYMHPPNRPNDREVVVPHRVSWPLPKHLAWRSDGEVAARWRMEGRKGRPPPRPPMTTVPLDRFGKAAEAKKEEATKEPEVDEKKITPEKAAHYIRHVAEDRDTAEGFARARTSEIAEHHGVSQEEALAALRVAAKKGLVTRGERVGTRGVGGRGQLRQGNRGMGELLWELKIPKDDD